MQYRDAGLISRAFARRPAPRQGGGGLIFGRHFGKKAAADEFEKRQISGEVTTKLPQPFSVEQTAYQAQMKDNAKDHENLFARMARAETDIAAIKADNVAQNRLLDRMANQIEKLYDRIICGKRKAD